MDIGSLLLALALILLVAAFIARPIFEQAAHKSEADSSASADALVAQREAVLIELRDLDFDHSTGKVSEEDFAAQRARLVAKGSEILRALDQSSNLQSSNLQRKASNSPNNVDDDIERLVRARRKGGTRERLAQGNGKVGNEKSVKDNYVCPECETLVQPGDKFCAKCGSQLPVAST